ncbi:MAG TPA: hypothetical protein VK465_12370 [Fibrobacteria bacterium]|nr:hypothetical protein [Fibrobacteria bacterium]
MGMTLSLSRWLLPPFIVVAGALFSWRLLNIPSRLETAAVLIAFFLVPTLKYPRFGVYYIFSISFFIPLFRRMYYLVADRPALDYLMLISDGVMAGLVLALALLWMVNKERTRGAMPGLVIAYTTLLFVKVFVGQEGSILDGLYGFKFHGLYVMFFFAGSYLITSAGETRRLMGVVSWILLATALYGVKQILIGFTAFEQKWIDSITFTTLYIEGVVRPFSTYVSPATLSDGMTILILAGAYWIFVRGKHTSLFGLLLIASAIWPLLIASVRTSWLATLAGLLFHGVFLRIRRGWGKGIILGALAAVVLLVAVRGGSGSGDSQTAALSTHMARKDRNLKDIMIRNRTQALANPLQEYSMQKRIQTWSYIWAKSVEHPFGSGQGTTGYAHSFYFQLLGETGFAGVLLFGTLLFLAVRNAFRVIRQGRDPEVVELTRLMLSLVFTISILNLTGTHLHTPPGDLFFWFSLGCIHRFHRNLQEDLKAGRPGPPAATAPAHAGAAASGSSP